MNDKNSTAKTPTTQPTCGIIMPIGAIDGCSAEHWGNVLDILKDVCCSAGFISNLVSDADEVGIIHKRIVENIYTSDIVVCDVSCKNPNVMFELGMRLAFDKPTIIIKDTLTDYSFDTSLIEHIPYPRDLRFNAILNFKEKLKKCLTATHEVATKDPTYSTFLKNFGQYKIAHLDNKEVTKDAYMLKAIEEIRYEMRMLRQQNALRNEQNTKFPTPIELLRRDTEIASDGLQAKLLTRFIADYLSKNNVVHIDDTIVQNMASELENNPDAIAVAGSTQRLRKFVQQMGTKLATT